MITLRRQFIELGMKQAETCRSNPDLYCEMLITEASQRNIMMNVYNAMLHEGMMEPIEKISREKQMTYWEVVKRDNAGRIRDIEKLKNIMRIHYCLDILLSL